MVHRNIKIEVILIIIAFDNKACIIQFFFKKTLKISTICYQRDNYPELTEAYKERMANFSELIRGGLTDNIRSDRFEQGMMHENVKIEVI